MKKGMKEIVELTYTVEDFTKEYEALVKKTGFDWIARPKFMFRDDGTYSIIIEKSIIATK